MIEIVPQATSVCPDFGSWIKHTRGIGMKLLIKDGYQLGKGIGKFEQGIVAPVPIKMLKPGAGLDYKRPIVRNNTSATFPVSAPAAADMFDFLNSTLNRHHKLSDSVISSSKVPHQDLSEKECQSNLLILNQKIASAQEERSRIMSAIDRSDRQNNRYMADHYRAKLHNIDASLIRLQSNSSSISSVRKTVKNGSIKSFKF
uniref:G-patch domain-containing protein n=1 Tax=Spongospora subterranea TaxID=70186 RepID=A0A0H5RC18_9EUKA|eukprot:CRZ11286.1 hypothetical protein [Spongospora subterranea]